MPDNSFQNFQVPMQQLAENNVYISPKGRPSPGAQFFLFSVVIYPLDSRFNKEKKYMSE